jgi:hypothetical protein
VKPATGLLLLVSVSLASHEDFEVFEV